ncbi:MAG TPA: hypothetical protein VHQ86_01250 [Candidatus Saccharimonadia bacterium]|jgi:hypothetical protein|nr:hypothetical protein [Candidatus Saccharimonadia bacterium]
MTDEEARAEELSYGLEPLPPVLPGIWESLVWLGVWTLIGANFQFTKPLAFLSAALIGLLPFGVYLASEYNYTRLKRLVKTKPHYTRKEQLWYWGFSIVFGAVIGWLVFGHKKGLIRADILGGFAMARAAYMLLASGRLNAMRKTAKEKARA